MLSTWNAKCSDLRQLSNSTHNFQIATLLLMQDSKNKLIPRMQSPSLYGTKVILGIILILDSAGAHGII